MITKGTARYICPWREVKRYQQFKEMKDVQFTSPMQLFLIKEIDNAWWNMQNEEGKVGLVPKDYLQPTRPQPEPPDEELDPKVQALIGMQLDNSSFYGLSF